MNKYIKVEAIKELLLTNSVDFICKHYGFSKQHLHHKLFLKGYVIPAGCNKLMYKDSAFINFLKLWWKNFNYKPVGMDNLISMALEVGYMNHIMSHKKRKLGTILSTKIRNGYTFKGKIIKKGIAINTNVVYRFEKI